MKAQCEAKWIQVPSGKSCKKGDTLFCPSKCRQYSTCPLKKDNSFKIVKVSDRDGGIAYTEEEIAKWWSGSTATADTNTSAPTGTSSAYGSYGAQEEPPRIQGKSEGFSPSKSIPGQDNASGAGRMTTISPSKSAPRQDNASNTESIPTQSSASASMETPNSFDIDGNAFSSLSIFGMKYSEDEQLIYRDDVYPLKSAFEALFKGWITQKVFRKVGAGFELTNEFKWLLKKALGRRLDSEDTNEIKNILENGEYGISEKFFYLFYKVVYRYNELDGFYWCDETRSKEVLTPKFKDRYDFFERYCKNDRGGEAFREMFGKRKREIYSFLNVSDPDEFFSDCEIKMANVNQEIYYITSGSYEPKYLGTYDEFVRNMYTPCGAELEENMIAFLKKNKITPRGAVKRPTYEKVEDFLEITREIGTPKEESDERMYGRLPLKTPNSAGTEYFGYITLLLEYMKEFKPSKIKVGELTFTLANYADEVRSIVKDLCKLYFAKADDTKVHEAMGRALLARSLHIRKILPEFIERNENNDTDEILELVTLLGNNKSDDNDTRAANKYIELFRLDALLSVNGKDLSVKDYIYESIKNGSVAFAVSWLEESVIAKAAFSKLRDNNKEYTLPGIFANMNDVYQKFTK